VGLLLGVFGVITLRHEIWPLTGHVGIIALYLVIIIPILAIFLVWYLNLFKYFKKNLGEKAANLIFKVLNFLVVFLIIFLILLMGVFFVAVT
jgi:hypothetical protein